MAPQAVPQKGVNESKTGLTYHVFSGHGVSRKLKRKVYAVSAKEGRTGGIPVMRD